MAQYTPKTWTTGETITAAELNAIEAAAAAAAVKADADAAYDAKGASTAAQAAAVQRANHTGTQSADTVIDGTTNKAYTAAEKTKLAGVATGATANATDALLRDRSTHTGTQAASTVTGLSTVATSGAYTDLSAKPTIPTVGAAGAGAAVALSSTDAAVTNPRTPTAHAASHAAGGSDAITPASIGGTPILTPTAVKTAAYTAVVGDLAMMNVAGGATALTLPSAPADKAQVGYRAIGATTATPLVINRGGTDTIGTAGAATASIPLADEVAILQYDAPNTRWLAVSNVKTQAALDARYGDAGVSALVANTGSATSAALKAAIAAAAPVASGTRVTMLGDSNSANGNNLPYWQVGIPGIIDGRSILAWTVLFSQGKCSYAGSYGVGGTTAAQARTQQVPQILAASPLPDVAVLITGTNDTTNVTSAASFTQWCIDYAGAADTLAAGGVLPVLTTIFPRAQWTSNDYSNLTKQNTYIRRLAATRGYPLVDLFATLTGPAGALFATGYGLAGDASYLHVSQAGAKACGQAIAGVLAGVLPPHTVPLQMTQAAAGGADGTGIPNGLFLTDSNADGLPDSWSQINANNTVSIVTDATRAPVGQVMKVARGAADGQTYISVPTVRGHRYSFACRLSADVKSVAGTVVYKIYNKDFGTDILTFNSWTEDIPAGSVFACEFTPPATSPFDGRVLNDASNMNVVPSGASGATIYLGQMSLVDLTSAGIV